MAAIDLAPWGGAAVAGMWRMAGEQFGGGSASCGGGAAVAAYARARGRETERGEGVFCTIGWGTIYLGRHLNPG